MRISDWSSDVCSSDLLEKRRAPLYEPLDSGRELKMKILAGNSNRPLAQAIADYLDLPLTDAAVRRFADEEVFVEIHENVRGEDVFVLQSTRSEEHTSELQSLMRISYAVFCLKK